MEKEKIEQLAEIYITKEKKKNHWELEEKILSYSGREEFTKEEVSKIVEWKNRRGLRLFRENNDSDVRSVTRETFEMLRGKEDDEDTIKESIRKLCKFHGVKVSVATAILMAHNPEKFTVMDWRVWNILFLLCYLKEPFSNKKVKPEHYILYLKACQTLADKLGVDLRTLDRALWISSKNYSND